VALITGRDSFDGGQPISESEWTQLLLKHGYAVLADKTERGDAASGPPVLPAPPCHKLLNLRRPRALSRV
jgi:hypothetical protein